jgi:hypothetical protein
MKKEKHPTAMAARLVCLISIGMGVLLAGYSLVTSTSEDAMVTQSYLYIPLLVGGLLGLPFNRRAGLGITLLAVFLWMLAAVGGLLVFYEVLWPVL